MSKHEVKVIRLGEILPHPNGDMLEITNVWGYQCIIRKGAHKTGDLMAYIEPDYSLPLDRNEFKFLDDGKGKSRLRVTMRRFRGEPSYGLLIPAPQGSNEGDNVMEILGIERWEPPPPKGEGLMRGIQVSGPDIPAPVYDLENWKKHTWAIPEGEEVLYLEKVHGCVHESTIIETNIGPLSAKEIVENKLPLSVKSFNHETGIIEYKPITDWMVADSFQETEWFEILLEDGKTIKLTGNHKVWLPELGCYREVKFLTEDDFFLVNE